MVFVETSAWFAYAVLTDPNHAAVSKWFASCAEAVVTTDYCLYSPPPPVPASAPRA
jgi:predicted nucleic acid-binding protein